MLRRKCFGSWIMVMAILAFGTFVGCGTTPSQQFEDIPGILQTSPPPTPQEYFIGTEDQLDVKFFYNPELNETVAVRPDGKISLQLIDDVQAAGLTPSQLDEILSEKYATQLKKPEITIIVRAFSGRRVYVGGEVARPGIIDLTGNLTPLQAVINAGGFMETAKPGAAILIRKGPDRRPVAIPLNLEDAMGTNIGDNDYFLRPDDIVYVPKSAIAKANIFVEQYIENLLLFRGVTLGFGYRLDDDDD